MNKINLLPDSFRVKSSTVKTAEMMKKMYIILFVMMFITAVTSIGLIYMYGSRMNNALDRKSTLERQIKAMEETEQRLILVKDRLSKVEQITKMKSAGEEIEGLAFILDNSGSYVILEEISASDQALDINLKSKSTVDTFEFMDIVKESNQFAGLSILSMEFTPRSGFETQISLIKK